MVNGSDFSGFIGELWVDIERTLKFKSNISVATQYGAAPDKDGNWKGMIGMLQRNEAQVAVSDFFPTIGRSAVVDYTSAIARTGWVQFAKL